MNSTHFFRGLWGVRSTQVGKIQEKKCPWGTFAVDNVKKVVFHGLEISDGTPERTAAGMGLAGSSVVGRSRWPEQLQDRIIISITIGEGMLNLADW